MGRACDTWLSGESYNAVMHDSYRCIYELGQGTYICELQYNHYSNNQSAHSARAHAIFFFFFQTRVMHHTSSSNVMAVTAAAIGCVQAEAGYEPAKASSLHNNIGR